MKSKVRDRFVAALLAFALCVQGTPTWAYGEAPEQDPSEHQEAGAVANEESPEIPADQDALESAPVVRESTEDDVRDVSLDAQSSESVQRVDDDPLVDVSESDSQVADTSDSSAEPDEAEASAESQEPEEGEPADVAAEDAILQAQATTTYNLNSLAPFAGRTRADVVARYSAALNAGGNYDRLDDSTWYAKMPSTESPYAAGVASAGMLNAMRGMTDFYRWLVGVEPLQDPCVNSDELQAGALVRNFDFNHSVSSSNKPSDMSASLWSKGANADHNILAIGYHPRGSITGWMNEGYDAAAGAWDTLGHRYAIISATESGIQFGYAGSVAIGNVTSYDNHEADFYAFPAPGYMPRELVYPSSSAWTLGFNAANVQVDDESAVKVQITNKSTGKTFTRTASADTLNAYYDNISFVQPNDAVNGAYTGTYEVAVTGLRSVNGDGTLGGNVTITYTTTFADFTNEVESFVQSVGAEFSDLAIYESLKSTSNLKKIAAVLPMNVVVTADSGMKCTVPVSGAWKLDTKNKCYTNSASASKLPSNLNDKKGRLKSIKIPYTISDDYYDSYNSLYLSPCDPGIGETVRVSVYRTNTTTDTSRVFKILPQSDGSYKGQLWLDSGKSASFDKKASDESVYGAYHIYNVKNIQTSQSGEYVSIYFYKEWGDTAYVSTSIEKLTVTKPSVARATVTGIITKCYTGKALTQDPVVKYAGKTLKKGSDYDISYRNNVNVGMATIIIKGKGAYGGTYEERFVIAERPSWSGATNMPVSSTADYKVTRGGWIRVKVNGKWATSDGVVSLSSPSDTVKRVTAKKTGTTTLYLLDPQGRQVASKKVTVFSMRGKAYELQSAVDSSYVLDIRGKSKADSARMIVWTRNNGKNQRYQFCLQSDGTYALRCLHSMKWVDVQGGGTKKSQPVIQYRWTGGINQRWKITVDAKDRVTLVSAKSGMVFDIQGGKVGKRAQMIQYPSNGGNNQKWVLNQK